MSFKWLNALFESWSTSRNNKIFKSIVPIDDSMDLNYAILITFVSLQNSLILIKLLEIKSSKDEIFYLPKDMWNEIIFHFKKIIRKYILYHYQRGERYWYVHTNVYYSYLNNVKYFSDYCNYYYHLCYNNDEPFNKLSLKGTNFNIYILPSDIRVNIKSTEFCNGKFLEMHTYIEYIKSLQSVSIEKEKLPSKMYAKYFDDSKYNYNKKERKNNRKVRSSSHSQRSSKKKHCKDIYKMRKLVHKENYMEAEVEEYDYSEIKYTSQDYYE